MIFAYIRASTGKQIRTIDAQREVIARYAAGKGLACDSIEYVEDEATSGTIAFGKRPGGSRINTAVAKGECSLVILSTLDRGFRVCSDALSTVDLWMKKGCALAVADFNGVPLDTSTPIGKMLLTMFAGFAEFERARIAERTSIVHQRAMENGIVIFGEDKIPFGYEADPTQGFVVNEKGVRRHKAFRKSESEQHIIGLIEKWHAEGYSAPKITAALKEYGYTRWHGGPVTFSAVRSVFDAVRNRKGKAS